MYTSIWNKYLPIIRILIKRSATADQTLELNLRDFERAGLIKKSGNKFEIFFSNGRADNILFSDLAKCLASTLVQDATIKDLFLRNDYHIAMSTKYQLSIRLTRVGELVESVEEVDEVAAS